MKKALRLSASTLLAVAMPVFGQSLPTAVHRQVLLADVPHGGRGQIQSYTMVVTGTCPGVMNLAWSGAPPLTAQGLLFAFNTGGFIIPSGHACAGTPTGLGTSGLQLVTTFATGPLGSGNLNFNVPPFACGGFIQLVARVVPCNISNVWGPL